MVVRGDDVLSTRRSGDDDELPGIWGLPAGTIRESETVEDVIARIGRDKLGVILKPVRQLTVGSQQRPNYLLEMELWEASMDGTPTHSTWRWAPIDSLRPGMTSGSLCCELALKRRGRAR